MDIYLPEGSSIPEQLIILIISSIVSIFIRQTFKTQKKEIDLQIEQKLVTEIKGTKGKYRK
jgi:hypothetical protein